jgi:hypothetical protein
MFVLRHKDIQMPRGRRRQLTVRNAGSGGDLKDLRNAQYRYRQQRNSTDRTPCRRAQVVDADPHDTSFANLMRTGSNAGKEVIDPLFG